MVTITSTTFCEAEDCPGHRHVQHHPGMDLVLTDDMALPLALVPSRTSGCPESVRCTDRFELCPPQCHPSSLPSEGSL